MTPLFTTGQLVTTPAVSELPALELLGALKRHIRGDWGDVCEEDKQLNRLAVHSYSRILSAYTINGTRIWIITEADRSYTTILLPEEY